MVIDPDVDPTVVEARISTAVPDDQDRRALLAPLVAAGPLPRTQRREQADGQVTLRHLEGPGQRLQDFLTREDVPLGGEMSADDMPGPREAFLPGVRRGAASRVDDADLALRRIFVRRHELLHDVLRCDPALQHRERIRSVRGVGVRLRRDRSDTSHGERHDGPDRDEFGFDGDAEILRLRVERDDTERRRSRSRHRRRERANAISSFPRSRNPYARASAARPRRCTSSSICMESYSTTRRCSANTGSVLRSS